MSMHGGFLKELKNRFLNTEGGIFSVYQMEKPSIREERLNPKK